MDFGRSQVNPSWHETIGIGGFLALDMRWPLLEELLLLNCIARMQRGN
jgi:hypothetical protein